MKVEVKAKNGKQIIFRAVSREFKFKHGEVLTVGSKQLPQEAYDRHPKLFKILEEEVTPAQVPEPVIPESVKEPVIEETLEDGKEEVLEKKEEKKKKKKKKEKDIIDEIVES